MWLIYNLKLVIALWLLNLNNLKYIIFLTIYVNIFLFEHWAPLEFPRHMKAAATTAADVWLLAGTLCTRKQQADSTLQSDLFIGNQNLAGHGCVCNVHLPELCLSVWWIYAVVWSLLFPVMDSTEDAIAHLCSSEKCISILVTVWKLLQLFMERLASVCGVYWSEHWVRNCIFHTFKSACEHHLVHFLFEEVNRNILIAAN